MVERQLQLNLLRIPTRNLDAPSHENSEAIY